AEDFADGAVGADAEERIFAGTGLARGGCGAALFAVLILGILDGADPLVGFFGRRPLGSSAGAGQDRGAAAAGPVAAGRAGRQRPPADRRARAGVQAFL